MENTGVDVVIGINSDMLMDTFNRVAACSLHPLAVTAVELNAGEQQGTAHIRIEVGSIYFVLALAPTIDNNYLHIAVDLVEASPGSEGLLQPLLENAPYNIDLKDILNDLGEVLTPLQCGVKASTAGGNSLILAMTFEEGTHGDWNQFYDSFWGHELFSGNQHWGAFIGENLFDRLIAILADEAMSDLGPEAEDLSYINLTYIHWPGDKIVLGGVGSYDMPCGMFGRAEVDFNWSASLTLEFDDCVLVTNIELDEPTPRGEEDLLQALLCSFSWKGFRKTLVSLGLNILVKVINKIFYKDEEGTTLSKQLIELKWPVLGKLRPSLAQIETDGILLNGKGPLETGCSIIDVNDADFKEVYVTPFPCAGRPTKNIYGEIAVLNKGEASLTICEAYFEDAGVYCGWKVVTSLGSDSPLIVLPHEVERIRVCYRPCFNTEFDTEYTANLVICYLEKSISDRGETSYTKLDETVSISAKYICSYYDGQIGDIDIGIGLDPETALIENLLEGLAFNEILTRIPWRDMPWPKNTMEVLELCNDDPVVSSLQVLDNFENVVAMHESAFGHSYLSFATEEGKSYSVFAKSKAGAGNTSDAKMARTVTTVRKYALVPAAEIKVDEPIYQTELSDNRLIVITKTQVITYDVSNLSEPIKLSAQALDKEGMPFAIVRKGGASGHLTLNLITIGDAASTIGSLKQASAASATACAITEIMLSEGLKANKLIAYRRYAIVANDMSVSIVSLVNIEEPNVVATVEFKARIRDLVVRNDVICLATEKGIETIDIKSKRMPVRVMSYATEKPVVHLEAKGYLLYATQEGGGTLIFESTGGGNLTSAGWYKQPFWRSLVKISDEISYSVSEEKGLITLLMKKIIQLNTIKLKRLTP